MHILLTRPRAESDSLAAALRALGDEVTIEPMLEIINAGEAPSLDGVQAVLATSANGIRAFATRCDRRDIPVFTVGDATARAASEAGFVSVESARGASAALYTLVISRLRAADGALLHVCGQDTAGDLAGMLQASGFEVRSAVLYRAEASTALSPAVRARLAAGEVDAILFFSPRTAKTFVNLVGNGNIGAACAAIDAVCLSPAVAEAAAVLAWRGVRVAASPDQAAMIEERNRMQGDKDSDKAAAKGTPATGDNAKSTSTLEKAVARDTARDSKTDPKDGKTGDRSRSAEPAKGVPASTSRGGSFGLVGVLAVLLVLAAAYIAWPAWGPALPGWLNASLAPVMEAGRSAGAAGRVEELSGKLAGLEREIAAMRGKLTAQPAIEPARIASLDDALRGSAEKIKNLETELATLRQALPAAGQSEEVASMARRLVEAESRIAALVADPGTRQAVEALDSLRTQSSARMTVLERENEALNKLIAAQDARMAALEKRPAAVAGTTRTNALVIAVGQLREAARGTDPFDTALSAVSALASEDPALQSDIALLAPLAKTGVPDLAALRLNFDRIARRIASEAYVPKGDGWIDKTLQQLSRLVSVKRTGPAAAARDDENGRVARAELRLAAGDLAGAVAALDGLTGVAAEAATPWLKDADLRLAVDRAVGRLFAEALRRTSSAGQDAPRG